MRMKSVIAWLSLLVFLGVVYTNASAQSGPWKLFMQFPELHADGKLITPVSMSLDPAKQRYYVVDANQGKILSFDADGQYLAAFDGGGQLKTPVSMARTSSGKFWIVERASNQLLYVDIAKKLIRDFTLQDQDARPIFPGPIALDNKDRLYLLDSLSGAVLMMDDDLKISRRFAAPAGSAGLCDFKIKSDGLFALDCLDKKVYGFDAQGNLKETIVLDDALMFPSALEIEGKDRIYILDRHAGKISVFDRQGLFKFDFLGNGKRPGQVSYGAFLLLDWANRLCVVEEGNGRVEVFARE